MVCTALLASGAATRLAAVPLLIPMWVAALVVHREDSWARKEFALLHAEPALVRVLTGPGRFSVDHLLVRRRASGRVQGPDAYSAAE